MLFPRTQSILKRVLSEKWFNFVYRIAVRLYGVWSKVSDRLFYLTQYAYYSAKGDASNAKKMKRIYFILPYTLVGRSGLLMTYELASDIEDPYGSDLPIYRDCRDRISEALDELIADLPV